MEVGQVIALIKSFTRGLKTEIAKSQPTATNSDIGKFLKLKSIDQNGKPTAFEYGSGGGGGGTAALYTGTLLASGWSNKTQTVTVSGISTLFNETQFENAHCFIVVTLLGIFIPFKPLQPANAL